MRVSLEWLREYVEIDLEAEELAERLTRAGFEVGAWEYLGAGLEKVFTGEIVRLERHPDADHLQVARVDLGPVGLMQLVTGAPNAAVGQKVVVALPGANLPNLGPVRQARFRGVVSEGVVCSAWELGLEGHRQEEGILILPPETPPGRAVAPYIGLDDTVLEIDITPNRADCLGLVNLAREVAAITGGRLRLPPCEVDSVPEPAREAATVTIEAP
ncbi:MAG: phenylalanine--tRNA ligase subunit beta, partial [Clostridia bacterium]|nr:phenylalanine--tRNA ligase subunit beta [Clostridia bacterium]